MIVLLTYLFVALIVSFFCSLLESIILSVSHSYIILLVRTGRRSGHMLQDMKRNINHPLAAILTLNTVANVVGAAGVGAQTYLLFGKEWVALASGILTVLILVCSEIIPKTLGAVYWKRLAPFAAYLLRGLILLTYPIVYVLEALSRFIARHGRGSGMTRDEIMVLAEIGETEGILHEKEARIIENILLLRDIKVGKILTPRSVMLAFHEDQTVEEVLEQHAALSFSRIPVYRDDRDDIVGFVLRKDLLVAASMNQAQQKVKAFLKPLYVVYESKSLADLLDEFISRHEHICLVIDEYGGTEGIVTLEDVIETLLGVEIVDEFDKVEDMRKLAIEKGKKHHRNRSLL